MSEIDCRGGEPRHPGPPLRRCHRHGPRAGLFVTVRRRGLQAVVNPPQDPQPIDPEPGRPDGEPVVPEPGLPEPGPREPDLPSRPIPGRPPEPIDRRAA
jgi:hypothetical protein